MDRVGGKNTVFVWDQMIGVFHDVESAPAPWDIVTLRT